MLATLFRIFFLDVSRAATTYTSHLQIHHTSRNHHHQIPTHSLLPSPAKKCQTNTRQRDTRTSSPSSTPTHSNFKQSHTQPLAVSTTLYIILCMRVLKASTARSEYQILTLPRLPEYFDVYVPYDPEEEPDYAIVTQFSDDVRGKYWVRRCYHKLLPGWRAGIIPMILRRRRQLWVGTMPPAVALEALT